MLKSQMNRTLNSMEKKKLISRERSLQDKRQVFISFHPENAAAYYKQHERILQMADAIIARLGIRKTQEVIKLLEQVSDMAREVL